MASLSPVLVGHELDHCKTGLFLDKRVLRHRLPELFSTGRSWPTYLIL